MTKRDEELLMLVGGWESCSGLLLDRRRELGQEAPLLGLVARWCEGWAGRSARVVDSIGKMMAEDAEQRWYGIRTIYHCGTKNDGTNVFEERVVVFSGVTPEEAHAKAGAESAEYAGTLSFEPHPEQMAYEQDGDPLIDGYEVWSELFESTEALEEFYQSRYGRYLYHPDG